MPLYCLELHLLLGRRESIDGFLLFSRSYPLCSSTLVFVNDVLAAISDERSTFVRRLRCPLSPCLNPTISLIPKCPFSTSPWPSFLPLSTERRLHLSLTPLTTPIVLAVLANSLLLGIAPAPASALSIPMPHEYVRKDPVTGLFHCTRDGCNPRIDFYATHRVSPVIRSSVG